MSRTTVVVTLLLCAVSGLAQTSHQQRSESQSAPQQLSEAVSVGYVMIPFCALGAKGRPLAGLRENDVALYVDDAQVRSDLFERSINAPVSFTILVDASGSMALAGKMEAARAAVGTLLSRRVPGDDFAVYEFADSEARELVPFTDDERTVRDALASIHPYGKTAFFDALASMPERSRLGRNPTRAIILLSDGIDNASKRGLTDLRELLEGVAIPIYALGLREPAERIGEESADLALLQKVAETTGGRLYVGNQPRALEATVSSIEDVLRTQYLIGFSPTGKGAVKYRHITLKLAGHAQSVQVRAGYRGTEPPLIAASATTKPRRNERKRS